MVNAYTRNIVIYYHYWVLCTVQSCAILLYDWKCHRFVYTSITTDMWVMLCTMTLWQLLTSLGDRNFFNSIIIFWDYHWICGPSLAQTLSRGALLYFPLLEVLGECRGLHTAELSLIGMQNAWHKTYTRISQGQLQPTCTRSWCRNLLLTQKTFLPRLLQSSPVATLPQASDGFQAKLPNLL